MTHKNWSDGKKVEARSATVIDFYRQWSERASIPADQQYWSLCGLCATDDGKPRLGSEIHQVITSGLIQPYQFIGVEIRPEIHRLNQLAYPDYYLYNGDIRHIAGQAQAMRQFVPAIINCDLVEMPPAGAETVADLMIMVAEAVPHEVLLVANFVLRRPLRKSATRADVMRELGKQPRYRLAMQLAQWERHDMVYEYDGTGKGCRMCTYLFMKSASGLKMVK